MRKVTDQRHSAVRTGAAGSDKAAYVNFRTVAGGQTSPPALITTPSVGNDREEMRIQDGNWLQRTILKRVMKYLLNASKTYLLNHSA